MIDEKCPRCSSDTIDTIELGTPIIKVGKTREIGPRFANAKTAR